MVNSIDKGNWAFNRATYARFEIYATVTSKVTFIGIIAHIEGSSHRYHEQCTPARHLREIKNARTDSARRSERIWLIRCQVLSTKCDLRSLGSGPGIQLHAEQHREVLNAWSLKRCKSLIRSQRRFLDVAEAGFTNTLHLETPEFISLREVLLLLVSSNQYHRQQLHHLPHQSVRVTIQELSPVAAPATAPAIATN